MPPPLSLDYFDALEDDLLKMARYIEFHPDNYQTYSLELVRLLLAAGSEIDVALKMLCKQVNSTARPTRNIDEHKAIVLTKHQDMQTQQVTISRYGITLQPWKDWQTANPKWWAAYNDVKHDRLINYRSGNLENVINAVGGLGIIMQFLAGPDAIAGGDGRNFRHGLGGLFTGLHLYVRSNAEE